MAPEHGPPAPRQGISGPRGGPDAHGRLFKKAEEAGLPAFGISISNPSFLNPSDKTLSLIKDRKLRQELGENARMDVRERFAPDIFIQKIEALIHTT